MLKPEDRGRENCRPGTTSRPLQKNSWAEIVHQTQEHTMKKSIAVIIAASTLFLAGCCTTPHATRWEYTVVEPGNPYTNQGEVTFLNEKSKEGWVFVQKDANGKYIFKRPSK